MLCTATAFMNILWYSNNAADAWKCIMSFYEYFFVQDTNNSINIIVYFWNWFSQYMQYNVLIVYTTPMRSFCDFMVDLYEKWRDFWKLHWTKLASFNSMQSCRHQIAEKHACNVKWAMTVGIIRWGWYTNVFVFSLRVFRS